MIYGTLDVPEPSDHSAIKDRNLESIQLAHLISLILVIIPISRIFRAEGFYPEAPILKRGDPVQISELYSADGLQIVALFQ